MNSLLLDVLPLGHLKCQYFRIVDGYDEQVMYQSPVSALLIRHPSLGNILYDTGNSPYHRIEYGEEINNIYPVSDYISVDEALKSKGLSCSDIDMIILSHLHFDHVGGLKFFKNSKAIKNIIVSENELLDACKNVFTSDDTGVYIKSLFDIDGAIYHPITDKCELAPDLTIFVQKSHTNGVIGLIIKTKYEGNIIVTSDAVYTRENWEKMLPPGGPINKDTSDFIKNIEFLKILKQRHNATMLFGHDNIQIKEWINKGTII